MRAIASRALVLVLAGCASVQKERGHDEIAQLVEERAGQTTGWRDGRPEDDAVGERLREMLADGLTAEEAVRIALLNSPALQRSFEEVGVAQSELLQAMLMPNPSISVGVGFPHQPGLLTEVSFSLVQELLNLALLPSRRSLAQDQFRATTLRIADEALEVVTQTRIAYTHVQVAQMAADERLTVVAASEAAMRMARLQFEAGNVSRLELATEQLGWEKARAAYVREELEVRAAREELTRLLGLWGVQVEWRIAEPLPSRLPDDGQLDDVEERGLRRRLDIAARRQELQLVDRALALARSSRFLGRVEVGVETEREAEGLRTTGPTLVLELPLFDRRQATVRRLQAEQHAAERRLAEVSVNARSDVRLARARLVAARRLVEHYERALLPAQLAVVEESQLQYNAMALSPFQLFEARRELAQTRRDYFDALADYWAARARLERSVGGALPEGGR